MIRRLVGLGIATAVLGIATAAAVWTQLLEPVLPAGSARVFVVERGESLRTIAGRLEREGLVRDATVTSWLARWRGLAANLHAGEYRLSPAQSPGEILDQLAEGRIATYDVVIPEGLTAAEIGARIAARDLVDAAEFAAAVNDPEFARSLGIPAPTLEGYLFPETYRLPRGRSGREVARVMVDQFERAWSELAPAAEAAGLDRHTVVVLASIVEKETGAASERPLIASVFANRLRRNMRLESDPTVIYGIPDFDGNLRRRDLENEANPYNTYRHAGLPPGPIASPGLDALRAVVDPPETDWLFFVSRNDGTHQFSRTYREHARAVDDYQRRRVSR